MSLYLSVFWMDDNTSLLFINNYGLFFMKYVLTKTGEYKFSSFFDADLSCYCATIFLLLPLGSHWLNCTFYKSFLFILPNIFPCCKNRNTILDNTITRYITVTGFWLVRSNLQGTYTTLLGHIIQPPHKIIALNHFIM